MPASKKATNYQVRVGYISEWEQCFNVTGVSASQVSASIQNVKAAGMLLWVKVANIGSSTWTPYVAIVGPDGVTLFTIWTAAAAISANSVCCYAFYMNQAAGSFTGVLSTILPKEFVVGATYGGTGTGDIQAWVALIPF